MSEAGDRLWAEAFQAYCKMSDNDDLDPVDHILIPFGAAALREGAKLCEGVDHDCLTPAWEAADLLRALADELEGRHDPSTAPRGQGE